MDHSDDTYMGYKTQVVGSPTARWAKYSISKIRDFLSTYSSSLWSDSISFKLFHLSYPNIYHDLRSSFSLIYKKKWLYFRRIALEDASKPTPEMTRLIRDDHSQGALYHTITRNPQQQPMPSQQQMYAHSMTMRGNSSPPDEGFASLRVNFYTLKQVIWRFYDIIFSTLHCPRDEPFISYAFCALFCLS